ncbi:uncharacterized protein LOC143859025 [Tasmannia lanceolata]|uniref:uncharacterized protein LOC143859025 n=1 Tax=Tasmannia lanceolata TaxID=3420 RepID=UPI0040631040
MEGWKDETKVIRVGGKVMCQDCTRGWNEWAHGTRPIQGCSVALTCMDERGRVVYYTSDETDGEGEFEMRIESRRLLREDFAGGRSGVKLSRPSHVYGDQIKYTLGSFYFTSPMCDEPDTTELPGQRGNY